MNDNPLEKEIEKKVCDYAKMKGFLVYKFTSPSRRSVPDRLFISPEGQVFFIEFKRKGEMPTISQTKEIERLRGQKVNAFVIDNVNSGIEVINFYCGVRN